MLAFSTAITSRANIGGVIWVDEGIIGGVIIIHINHIKALHTATSR
jgi:hypothetical protein